MRANIDKPAGPDLPSAEESPRILIVDDEAVQVEALCDSLRDHGYVTTGFTSARAALAAIRDQDFDLLLTDLLMPEMDGVQFLRAAVAEDADLVAIMITGHGTIASAVAAMKAGAFDYILKPFDLSHILPILARSLILRRSRAENAELERLVHRRTAELESSNRELDAFSRSVAHDLHTPLRTIGGLSEAVLRDHGHALNDECKQHLRQVTKSAQQMGQTIEDLLALSRVSRSEIRRNPISLSELAEVRLAKLRLSQPQRRIEVVIEPGMDVQCDAPLLGIALDNLLSNAWKFTAKRADARIEVGRLPAAAIPTFFVRDNGAGFDPAQAHRLFGVFQRLHSQSDFAGTGIGLSTTQRIIQRHGGKIWAEGRLGAGATFFFTLPSGQEETRPHRRKGAGAASPMTTPTTQAPRLSGQ